jgi:hypothetical protein
VWTLGAGGGAVIRYRYYVSCQNKERLKLRRLRVLAGDLERMVIAQIHAWRGTASEQPKTRGEVRSAMERIMVTADAVHIDFIDRDGSIVIPVRFSPSMVSGALKGRRGRNRAS